VRRLVLAGLAACALLALSPGARAAAPGAPTAGVAPTAATASSSPTDVLGGSLNADNEAFGVRVEYDLPAPAGSGSVPHVVADVSRQDGSDSAHGIAGAPSELDAVVGGEFVDPDGLGGGVPQRNLPQTECYYPGDLLDTVERFPTDTQAATSSLPPVSVATAQCGAGPYAELHAVDAGIGTADSATAGLAALVQSGAAEADSIARTDDGRLVSDADATVSDLDILGGAIHIGSVTVSDDSSTTGAPGGGSSVPTISISGATVGGVPVSVDDNQLTVAGLTAPVGSTAGIALTDALDGSLDPVGCAVTAVGTTHDYPQGFLLARPPPAIGVTPDGRLAASMIGGLLFVCNLPASITEHLNGFSPERAQILVGFAYSSVQTSSDPGGFGIGNLGGEAGTGSTLTTPTRLASIPTLGTITQQAVGAPRTASAPTGVAAATSAPAPIPVVSSLPGKVLRINFRRLDPGDRALLFGGCLLLWLVLTAVGLRRLRGVTAG